MPPLHVQLFGRFAVTRAGQPLPLPGGSAHALLACLLLAPGHTLSRERLSTCLWPDAPPQTGRRRLSQALHQLRAAFGQHGRFPATRDHVSLDPADLDVDLWQFDRLAASADPADWAAAVALHAGDLLPDLYDDWALLPRLQRQETRLGLLERLADHAQAQGDLPAALACARRLTQADPLRESAHQQLLRLLGRAGRFAAAQAHYAHLRRLLQAELGIDPLPETTAILRGIQREAAAAADADRQAAAADDPHPLPPPFVGRAAERARLVAALEQTLQGHGALLAVEGAAGIGKSRLLRETAVSARWRGLPALSAAALPNAANPLQPLTDALRALSPAHRHALAAALPPETRAAAGLLPEWPAAAPAALPPRQQLAHRRQAVHDLFAALAAQTPVCLLLDDLHHAGPDLWPFLDTLAQLAARAPLCLILAYRRAELPAAPGWQTLAGWEQAGRLALLPLPPLGADEAARLIPPPLAAQRAALLTAGGGSPFWLGEAIAAAAAGRDPAASVAARAAALPPPARDALAAAAVLGTAFSWPLWTAVTPVTPAAAEQLVAAHFLQATADGFAFRHELLQSGVYAALPAAIRLAHHRQAAAVLARQAPDDLAARAWHHAAAGELAAAAAAYRQLAAARRAQGALPGARQALERALALTPDGERLPLLLDLLRVLLIVEETAVADHLPATLALAAAADPALQAQVELLAGEYERKCSRFAAAAAHLQAARDLGAALGAAVLQADALHQLGETAMQMGDIPMAQARWTQLRALARAHALPAQEAAALEGLGWALANLGDPAGDALDHFRQALALRRQAGDLYGEARSTNDLASALQAAGRLDEAVAVSQAGIALSERIGFARGAAIARAALAMACNSLGQSAQALPLAEAVVDYFTRTGAMDGVGLYTGLRGLTLERLGRMAEAEALLRQAVDILQAHGAAFLAALTRMDLGTLLARSDRYTEALPILDAALAVFTENGAPMEAERTAALLGLACWHTGDAPRARVLAAAGRARFAQGAPQGEERQYYLWALWQLLAAVGETAVAEAVLREAYATLQRQAALLANPDLRRGFFADVPVNHEIAAAFAALEDEAFGQQPARLARRGTPLGRPLGEADYVTVTWTPRAPEDALIADKGERRRAALRRLLAEAAAQGAAPTDADLAAALGVSRRTVLRDMAALAAAGAALPTRKRKA